MIIIILGWIGFLDGWADGPNCTQIEIQIEWFSGTISISGSMTICHWPWPNAEPQHTIHPFEVYDKVFCSFSVFIR